ncbi:MAG: hypothetical protein ACRD2J_16895 [Thermoanaerobaculia bacterium]
MAATRKRRPLLEEYLIRLELALGAIGNEPLAEVITSRDRRLGGHEADLKGLSEEVRQWTPPFGGTEDLLTSVTIAGPGSNLGPAAHLEGDAIRFVLNGSVWFAGEELGPGDWLFIPSGAAYRLRVGYRGVISLLAIFRPGEALPFVAEPEVSLAGWAE